MNSEPNDAPQDLRVVCMTCQSAFVLSAGEMEFYRQRGCGGNSLAVNEKGAASRVSRVVLPAWCGYLTALGNGRPGAFFRSAGVPSNLENEASSLPTKRAVATVTREDLLEQVGHLRAQLASAHAEISALKLARDTAIRMSVWGGRRLDGRTRNEP
jgi:hypothetical protein